MLTQTGANAGSIADALAKAGSTDQLWEANWDDEDIEDDFAKKLRYVWFISVCCFLRYFQSPVMGSGSYDALGERSGVSGSIRWCSRWQAR